MTRVQILRAYLEDKLLIEKGYLVEGQGAQSKWDNHRDNKMVEVIKFAIEGVMNNDSQTLMTRKINKFLES